MEAETKEDDTGRPDEAHRPRNDKVATETMKKQTKQDIVSERLSKVNQAQKEKIKLLEKIAAFREMQECTFTPKTNADKFVKSRNHGRSETITDRLYQDALKRKERLAVDTRSRAASAPAPRKLETRSLDSLGPGDKAFIYERLFNEAEEVRRRKLEKAQWHHYLNAQKECDEMMKSKRELEEMRKKNFGMVPISGGGGGGGRDPLYDPKFHLERTKALEKQRIEREQQDCTFTPTVNRKSSAIVNRAGLNSSPVHERLADPSLVSPRSGRPRAWTSPPPTPFLSEEIKRRRGSSCPQSIQESTTAVEGIAHIDVDLEQALNRLSIDSANTEASQVDEAEEPTLPREDQIESEEENNSSLTFESESGSAQEPSKQDTSQFDGNACEVEYVHTQVETFLPGSGYDFVNYEDEGWKPCVLIQGINVEKHGRMGKPHVCTLSADGRAFYWTSKKGTVNMKLWKDILHCNTDVDPATQRDRTASRVLRRKGSSKDDRHYFTIVCDTRSLIFSCDSLLARDQIVYELQCFRCHLSTNFANRVVETKRVPFAHRNLIPSLSEAIEAVMEQKIEDGQQLVSDGALHLYV